MLTIIIILSVALLAAAIYIVALHSRAARLDERLQASDKALAEEKARTEREGLIAEKRFAELAAKSLASNAEALRRQSRNGMEEVLAPMKEDLANFRQTVLDSYSREARERFSLGERVRELIDLNRAIGSETRRLTDALKGNSRFQGDWGETILANILSTAGLREGYEYHLQANLAAADSGRRLRPDVILTYTPGRNIIIDSKVSIQAYFDMLNAPDDAARERSAKAHIASVKKHIAELRDKKYQDEAAGDTFDYVLMFIPHEGAFLAAMDLDHNLWESALAARVLIIAPTHLMAVVKLIEQMWRQEKQNRNALAIAEEAGRMLDKLQGFTADMQAVDRALSSARQAYSSAYSKLAEGPGNLINRARKLQTLGAKARKPLPPAADADDERPDA
ncbi:MAG: DNA recombination protein RmuC [Muribaculaceae bacterium]|nr:DNA recombination protein RmuC [Muribaculaceae bacterium]